MLPFVLALIMGTALGMRGGILSFVLFGIAVCGAGGVALMLTGSAGVAGIAALGSAILGYNLGLGAGLAATALRPAPAD